MSDEPDYKAALLAIINGEQGYVEVWQDDALLIDGFFDSEPVTRAVEALVAEGLVERSITTSSGPVVETDPQVLIKNVSNPALPIGFMVPWTSDPVPEGWERVDS